MTEEELIDIKNIYSNSRESTHSHTCYKWHITCALFKVIQAYESLLKEKKDDRDSNVCLGDCYDLYIGRMLETIFDNINQSEDASSIGRETKGE